MAGASSFDEFFLAEHQSLLALAIGLIGDREAVRDLVQDTMSKALVDWGRIGALDRPGAWARRVTINAAMSWHRSRRREQRAVVRLGPAATTDLPESESARFWAAVRALPERQRAVVALYYLEDRNVAEIAATLQMPAGTVKSALHTARGALSSSLGLHRGRATNSEDR